jgi:hypothetical protein
LYLTIGTGGYLIALQMKRRAFITAFGSSAGLADRPRRRDDRVNQCETALRKKSRETWRISMTYNKYTNFLMYEDGEEYDTTYKAGTRAPFSGIYYCEACGGSITLIGSQPLPPQEHHLHTPAQGSIRWRLAVKSHYG